MPASRNARSPVSSARVRLRPTPNANTLLCRKSNMLSPQELASAANANFVTHDSWVAQHTPGMHIVDEEGYLLVDSGLPCDTFNIVCRARLTRAEAHEKTRAVVR